MSTPDLSSPAAVAAFLRQYNTWRRDESELDAPDRPKMPAPADLGRVIDAAVRMLEASDIHFQSLHYIAWEASSYVEAVQHAKEAIRDTGVIPKPPRSGHAKQQEADHSENGLELVGRLGCNSQHGGYRPDSPCRYRMRITDPGCTGCADRDEGGTDHANELRRMARKVGHPAGDVPAVMRAAADRIDELERLVAAFQRAEAGG